MNEVSFIIANGTSRKEFDLNLLKGHGIIYGCNALYRDYRSDYKMPDYLVAIDQGMIDEINASDFPKSRFIVPPHDECWEPVECNPRRPRSNAGVNAIREAIKRGSTSVIGLGFDFVLADPKQSISNIYDGTQNYGMEVRARCEDNLYRTKYMNWVAKTNPSVLFFLVYPHLDYGFHRIEENNIYILEYSKLLSNIK